MRIDGDGKAIYELTLLLTPAEAQQVIGGLQAVLEVVPSEERVNHTHVDDATEDEGGRREITLVIYGDQTVEREHDAQFGVE